MNKQNFASNFVSMVSTRATIRVLLGVLLVTVVGCTATNKPAATTVSNGGSSGSTQNTQTPQIPTLQMPTIETAVATFKMTATGDSFFTVIQGQASYVASGFHDGPGLLILLWANNRVNNIVIGLPSNVTPGTVTFSANNPDGPTITAGSKRRDGSLGVYTNGRGTLTIRTLGDTISGNLTVDISSASGTVLTVNGSFDNVAVTGTRP